MGFILTVSCRKGFIAQIICLLALQPLAKSQIPKLSEWMRNEQEPPEVTVNLSRSLSMGVHLAPQIRRENLEDLKGGDRVGWGLSQRTRRWYKGPSGESSLKGCNNQTHMKVLRTCWLYPLQTKKKCSLKSYLNPILHIPSICLHQNSEYTHITTTSSG